MIDSSTELTVLDRVTGEIVDVRGETTERLAKYIDDLGELRSQLAEQEEIVQRELVSRLDHEAATTLRVGDFELKVPGANAGTTAYDPNVLGEILRMLIMAGTVSEKAAAKALKRQVTVTLEVPFTIPLGELAASMDGNVFAYDGREMEILLAGSRATPVVSGINALRKLPGVSDALDRAEVTRQTPRRRVKVSYVGRQP